MRANTATLAKCRFGGEPAGVCIQRMPTGMPRQAQMNAQRCIRHLRLIHWRSQLKTPVVNLLCLRIDASSATGECAKTEDQAPRPLLKDCMFSLSYSVIMRNLTVHVAGPRLTKLLDNL